LEKHRPICRKVFGTRQSAEKAAAEKPVPKAVATEVEKSEVGTMDRSFGGKPLAVWLSAEGLTG
ncbi:unnamed protein product, partial [Durusdinium trenchii]